MKRTFPTIILALALVGCDKVERSDQAQVPAEQPAPAPAPTPTPPPISTVQAPTPTPAPRLTPDGTFLLLQRVDITTDSGVMGLEPGTLVKLVRKTDTGMVLSNDGHEFTVLPQAVTNDLDVAARAAKADATAMAVASSAASVSATTNAELSKAQAAINDLQSRRQVYQAEESRILKQIDAANDAQTRYSVAKTKGMPIPLDPIVAQLPVLRSRLQKVRDDMNALK